MPRARTSASNFPPNTSATAFNSNANLAWARQLATIPVSIQFLFDNSRVDEITNHPPGFMSEPPTRNPERTKLSWKRGLSQMSLPHQSVGRSQGQPRARTGLRRVSLNHVTEPKP